LYSHYFLNIYLQLLYFFVNPCGEHFLGPANVHSWGPPRCIASAGAVAPDFFESVTANYGLPAPHKVRARVWFGRIVASENNRGTEYVSESGMQ
jgi:hypothetical protein